MSMKRGSLIKILIVLITIGLLLGPVVSAAKLYPYPESYSPLPNFNVFTNQLNPGPIQYSMHIRAGSQEYNNSPNNWCPGSYIAQFVMVIPFPQRLPIQ